MMQTNVVSLMIMIASRFIMSSEWCLMLIADVHRAQQTDKVKELLAFKHTNVPPGCTRRVQPLDVSFNKPFKNAIKEDFEKHINENLDSYVMGKIRASERRVVITKWVARSQLCKCGLLESAVLLAVALDGSENEEVNIEGLEGYVMPSDRQRTLLSILLWLMMKTTMKKLSLKMKFSRTDL